MKKSHIVIVIIASFFSLIGSFLALLVRWGFSVWAHLTVDEVIYHLMSPIEGTGDGLIMKFVLNCVVPSVIIAIFVALFVVIVRKKYAFVVSLIITIFCVIAGGVASIYAYKRLDLGTYISKQMEVSTFIEDNYVSPDDVTLTFPEEKRNLIYIFLESGEMTFADKANGGAFENNVIPELTELAESNECFSGDEHTLNGGYVMPYTAYTMGGMFAQTSGLPLKMTIDNHFMQDDDIFFNGLDMQKSLFPGISVLGDVLAKEGYKQVLFIGSNSKFGGRQLYFESHGGYEMDDYQWAVEKGLIPRGYRTNDWGYEDMKLFAYAKDRLIELAKEDQPFNLTMLTVDTHFEDGTLCELCRNDFDDQYSNVYACSSRQVAEFVEWIKQQDFYDNTTIVISGDHCTMDSDYCVDVDDNYDRRVYTTYINSAVTVSENVMRTYTTMDNFPTTLAAMGVDIEGNKLGLGTNLFSKVPTICEQYGVDYFAEEIEKKSVFMEKMSGVDAYSDDMYNASKPKALLQVESIDGDDIKINLVDFENIMVELNEVRAEYWDNSNPKKVYKQVFEGLDNGNYIGKVSLAGIDKENCTIKLIAQDKSGVIYELHTLTPNVKMYNVHTYIEWLKNNNYNVMISAKDDASNQFGDVKEDMQSLGLKEDLTGKMRYAYIAIIEDGEVKYEESDEGVLNYSGEFEDGTKFDVGSSGYDSGSISSISVDNKEYSIDKRGLNFVVYDPQTKKVIDSVCFDTNFGLYVSREQNDTMFR